MINPFSGRLNKVCPRCGVINGLTVTYCVECGQSLKASDLDKVVPYDESTRRTFQVVHKQKLQRTLKGWTYLLAGVIVIILLSLIFAPLSTSTINVAVSPSGLSRSEHYEILIDGGYVGEGDIAPGPSSSGPFPIISPGPSAASTISLCKRPSATVRPTA